MKNFELAFKNLWRNKRRTILTSSILTFAVTYYIVIAGILDGFEIESLKNLIDLESGHIKITSPNYNEKTFEGRLRDYQDLEKNISRFPFVKGICPRLKVNALMDNGIDEIPVVLVGIHPDKDRNVFNLGGYVSKELNDGVYIGEVLAEKMNLKETDYVFLTFLDKNGSLTSSEFEIKGILKTPSFLINNVYVFINIDYLSEIGGFDNEVSEVFIKTDNFKKVSSYGEILRKHLINYKFTTWIEEGKDFLTVNQVKRVFQWGFVFFIILIGIIGVSNSLVISIYERIREIGTLKAIGMTDKEISTVFVFEGFLIGVIGSFLGLILGGIINYFLVNYGIDWSTLLPRDVNLNYRVIGVVKNSWNILSLIISPIVGSLSGLFAAYLPILTIRKLTPQECLRWYG